MVPSGYKKGAMLDLVLEPADKYACCFKDVRVCGSAEGAASDHHLVTTLISLHFVVKNRRLSKPGQEHNGHQEQWPNQSAITQPPTNVGSLPHSVSETGILTRISPKPLGKQLKLYD